MSVNHPIKAGKRYILLGWFVLFSVLAHGIFLAIPASQNVDRLVLQFSSPLQVTVISSRPSSKPVPAVPPAQSIHTATTELQHRQLPDLIKPGKKPVRAAEIRVAVKKLPDIKSTNDAVILKTTHVGSITDTENLATTRSTKLITLNHLRQLLKASIKARFTYPRIARRMGWEGLVGLSLHIENDGSLKQVRIARSSGYKTLDDNARKTIQSIGRLQLASNMIIQAANTEIEVLYKLTD